MIDYQREPHSDIAFIDMKSFYASVECVQRGLHPLRTSLCVMSRSDNSKGLILAASPTFKEVFGKKNVGRSYDLPFLVESRKFNYALARRQGLPTNPEFVRYIETWAQKTLIVPPRMALYIEENLKIQAVLENYGPKEDILAYSIDEAFIDLTRSLNYFVPANLSRRDKLDLVSARIQHEIHQATGVYSTVGMSNANPLLAKLALDIEAKHTPTMRANWSYEDVKTKVWQIPKLTDFWGIGERTAKRLNRLGIYSIKDLAQANPDLLHQEFGVIGLQLWFHAHGVDESNVRRPYQPQSKGIGNSQILPKDYHRQKDIELVLSEMAEQVAIRLRRAGKNCQSVAIHIGFSKGENRRSINRQRRIDPTQRTRLLCQHVLELFRQHYRGGAVRQIGVRYQDLVDESYQIISLFDDLDQIKEEERLETCIDQVREKYGFLSIQRASVLQDHSRNYERSRLIGGHAAGGAGGLEGLQ